MVRLRESKCPAVLKWVRFWYLSPVALIDILELLQTGKSKGYAFVEFSQNDVAQIVAETMNNYLMFERLVKGKFYFFL